MQKFNATNVVLNSIRLATPCKSGGRGGWKFAQKFSAEKRQFVPTLRRKKLNYPGLRRKTPKCPGFTVF